LYTKGLHIISTIHTKSDRHLTDVQVFKEKVNDFVTELSLTSVGAVFHDFEGGGFTAVVCLTESHLSIHTWPEYNRITLDVFLSNNSRNNEDRCRALHDRIIEQFEIEKIETENILR